MEQRISIERLEQAVNIFGSFDENIRLLENTFKARMEDAETAFCDDAKITWKPQERTTFDYKKFAKYHPGLDLSKYTKTSTFRVFKIKEEN